MDYATTGVIVVSMSWDKMSYVTCSYWWWIYGDLPQCLTCLISFQHQWLDVPKYLICQMLGKKTWFPQPALKPHALPTTRGPFKAVIKVSADHGVELAVQKAGSRTLSNRFSSQPGQVLKMFKTLVLAALQWCARSLNWRISNIIYVCVSYYNTCASSHDCVCAHVAWSRNMPVTQLCCILGPTVSSSAAPHVNTNLLVSLSVIQSL